LKHLFGILLLIWLLYLQSYLKWLLLN